MLPEMDKVEVQALPKQVGRIDKDLLLVRLDKAISRRNRFIHQGEIKDYGEISGDIALIRLLVSLYILHLLQYPIQQLNDFDPDILMIDWAMQRNERKQ